jgi:arylsulfatase
MNGQTPGKDGFPGKYRPLTVERSLYNMSSDPGETTDVAAQNPEVVKRLEALAESMREDLGDDLNKRPAKGARAPGT